MESKVYIVAAKRSAIGKFQGGLAKVSPVEIGQQLVKHLLSNQPSLVAHIDEVIVGNVLSAGHGQNIARQIAIKGGISEHVPAYTINMVCGSGLKAVYEAFIKIKYGLAHGIIAGGVESMSQAALLLDATARVGTGLGDVTIKDSLLKDGLTDAFSQVHMGITAENLAQQFNVSREAQDEFALNSQVKARLANDQGDFIAEIAPISWTDRKGNVCQFVQDEYINYQTNSEKLAKLKPAFKSDGTVTAGNASGINDGGAMLCIVSEKLVDTLQLTPLAELVGFGQSGIDPQIMGLGPVAAIECALAHANLSLAQMAVLELNEAFAAQSIAVMQQLSQQYHIALETLIERANPRGGAIALGHPIGASGARILTTLIHELQPEQYGLASLCVGGGMGIAAIIKAI